MLFAEFLMVKNYEKVNFVKNFSCRNDSMPRLGWQHAAAKAWWPPTSVQNRISYRACPAEQGLLVGLLVGLLTAGKRTVERVLASRVLTLYLTTQLIYSIDVLTLYFNSTGARALAAAFSRPLPCRFLHSEHLNLAEVVLSHRSKYEPK